MARGMYPEKREREKQLYNKRSKEGRSSELRQSDRKGRSRQKRLGIKEWETRLPRVQQIN